jgi:hypothetical protein
MLKNNLQDIQEMLLQEHQNLEYQKTVLQVMSLLKNLSRLD